MIELPSTILFGTLLVAATLWFSREKNTNEKSLGSSDEAITLLRAQGLQEENDELHEFIAYLTLNHKLCKEELQRHGIKVPTSHIR